MEKKHVAVFMGTRPEGIKMAPVVTAFEQAEDFDVTVVSTGQHREMLQQVVDLFQIRIDHELAVMRPNQTLAGLTARLTTGIDELLENLRPDIALVQGDTTTVLVTALTCFYRGIATGHVEAGLRTWNIQSPFPEEANRRLAAPIVSIHFPPTEFGRDNLHKEGIADERIHVTGNTVIDALFMETERQRDPAIRAELDAKMGELIGDDWRQRPYVLITGHRRENFGQGFAEICDALVQLADQFADHRFVYPVHLNPNVQKPVYDRLGDYENIKLILPQPYREFVALMNHCTIALTDSGGVQEEAPSLGKPVLVMRDTTERPEGVEAGTVKLVGPHADRIIEHVSALLTDQETYARMSEAKNPYGDGHAAARIVEAIRQFLDKTA